MKDKIYTSKETAKYLRISSLTLQRWAKSGKLIPDRKASRGDRFYLESTLIKFVNSLPTDSDRYGINESIEMLPSN